MPKANQRLVLIRGLPGSGKSTRARAYYQYDWFEHYEADMFMLDTYGNYKFDRQLLPPAHLWCYEETRGALLRGVSVVVSNTFIQKWEAQPYIDLSKELNISLEIITCTGQFKSIHGVPEETMESMRARWEDFSV